MSRTPRTHPLLAPLPCALLSPAPPPAAILRPRPQTAPGPQTGSTQGCPCTHGKRPSNRTQPWPPTDPKPQPLGTERCAQGGAAHPHTEGKARGLSKLSLFQTLKDYFFFFSSLPQSTKILYICFKKIRPKPLYNAQSHPPCPAHTPTASPSRSNT